MTRKLHLLSHIHSCRYPIADFAAPCRERLIALLPYEFLWFLHTELEYV